MLRDTIRVPTTAQITCRRITRPTGLHRPGQGSGPLGVPAEPDRRGEFTRLADRYTIGPEIGRGGFGRVCEAVARHSGQPVAIKLLNQERANDADAIHQLAVEGALAQQFQHPNIVDVLEAGPRSETGPYIVMEYLDGDSLDQTLNLRVTLPAPEAVRIVIQIAEALALVHGRGYVYLDLKPQNVVLVHEGDQRNLPKLVDFGTAAHKDADPSRPLIGTPLYLAPEQIRYEPVDQRTDVYALGIVLYELVCGGTPFEFANGIEDVLLHHLTVTPAPPRERRTGLTIPPRIEDAILRAIEKKPENRFPTMGEFAEELRRSL